jgi:hypothetical protein
MGRKRDRSGAIDDLAVQLSKPPVLVAGGSLIERLDISRGGHVTTLSHPLALREAPRPSTPCRPWALSTILIDFPELRIPRQRRGRT